jgi:hypothetical protein
MEKKTRDEERKSGETPRRRCPPPGGLLQLRRGERRREEGVLWRLDWIASGVALPCDPGGRLVSHMTQEDVDIKGVRALYFSWI